MRFSKALLSDVISLLFVAAGYFLHSSIILNSALFALSGSLTNHLAIYMLYHKVPFLYGSGVIEQNFQAFKESIKEMIMSEFFTKDRLESFLQNEQKQIDLKPMVVSADFDPAFDALSQSVMESKLGSALQLFGGTEALETLREPFNKRLKSAVVKIVSSETFKEQMTHRIKNSSFSDDFEKSIRDIVEQRLEELSSKKVKEMIQRLISEHLGWLVLWGALLGAVIGLLLSTLGGL